MGFFIKYKQAHSCQNIQISKVDYRLNSVPKTFIPGIGIKTVIASSISKLNLFHGSRNNPPMVGKEEF